MDTTTRERYLGSMIGLAVGDAIGAQVEFMLPGGFEPVADRVGGGVFGLPAGAFTDDTSMALCLAQSLVECGRFDPVDQLERYLRWMREGYMSSIGRAFDVGGTCADAILRFEATRQPMWQHEPSRAGNGSIMRPRRTYTSPAIRKWQWRCRLRARERLTEPGMQSMGVGTSERLSWALLAEHRRRRSFLPGTRRRLVCGSVRRWPTPSEKSRMAHS